MSIKSIPPYPTAISPSEIRPGDVLKSLVTAKTVVVDHIVEGVCDGASAGDIAYFEHDDIENTTLKFTTCRNYELVHRPRTTI